MTDKHSDQFFCNACGQDEDLVSVEDITEAFGSNGLPNPSVWYDTLLDKDESGRPLWQIAIDEREGAIHVLLHHILNDRQVKE